MSLPLGYLSGFSLSIDPVDTVNSIDVTPGICRDSTNSVDISMASPAVISLAGQPDVCDGNLVRLGADIDTLGTNLRYDGTHFTMPGGLAQAALKVPLYQNYLSSL